MAKPNTPRTRKTNGNNKPANETPQIQSAAQPRTTLSQSSTATSTSFIATQIDLESQIRQRAYQFYEERGCTPGQQDDDWLRAEHEIRSHNGHHHA